MSQWLKIELLVYLSGSSGFVSSYCGTIIFLRIISATLIGFDVI